MTSKRHAAASIEKDVLMKTSEDLKTKLKQIDHKGYPAYKDLKGNYSFGRFILGIDHVQGDPYAAPSRLSVRIDGKNNELPTAAFKEKHVRIAVADFILRNFARQAADFSHKAKGSGKSGLMAVSRCGQEVLERTGCEIDGENGEITVRFSVGFPANGRTINARELKKVLFEFIPKCVERSCIYKNMDKASLDEVIHLAIDQHYIREQLKELDLVAFVADGAILPRCSGDSDKPLKEAVAFKSPESMRITLKLPYRGSLSGMAIRKGITLIVGGGYHGKSTLLKALERGVYNHIAGDGREYVIALEDALKVRAEDGRCVTGTDISWFINNLPGGKSTEFFFSENASGSTSQAANLMEGIESGSRLLLIDEDTCATNFMIRDRLMECVVSRDKEPITPFLERARDLSDSQGISIILVAGSCGAYFHIADTVIQMDSYLPIDITKRAKECATRFSESIPEKLDSVKASDNQKRVPLPNAGIRKSDRVKTKSFGLDCIQIEHEEINLRLVEQLVDSEQLTALSMILVRLEKQLVDGRKSIGELVDIICDDIAANGCGCLSSKDGYMPTDAAFVRRQEIFAMINRYRSLKLKGK